MTSEPRLETERKKASHEMWGRWKDLRVQRNEREKELGAVKEGVVGVGKVGRAGQGDMGEVAGTRPDYAEPPGAMVGAGFILNVVNCHQRKVNDLYSEMMLWIFGDK